MYFSTQVVMGGGRRNFRDEQFLDEEHGTPSRRKDGRDLIQVTYIILKLISENNNIKKQLAFLHQITH